MRHCTVDTADMSQGSSLGTRPLGRHVVRIDSIGSSQLLTAVKCQPGRPTVVRLSNGRTGCLAAWNYSRPQHHQQLAAQLRKALILLTNAK